jgi:hypothetical protein
MRGQSLSTVDNKFLQLLEYLNCGQNRLTDYPLKADEKINDYYSLAR